MAGISDPFRTPPMDSPLPRGQLRRALKFLAPHRKTIGVILALALAAAALSALEPLVLKYIFDRLSPGTASSALVLGIALMAGLGVLREAMSQIQNWLSWRTRIWLQFTLTSESIGKLHRLPLSFHRNEGVGAIMTRLDRGTSGFASAVTDIGFNVIPSVVYLVVAVVIMFRLDWRLALAVAFFAPLPAIIAAVASPTQVRRERTLMDRWVKIYQHFNEVLGGIVTVRSFAMEEREKQRFLKEVEDTNAIVVRGVGQDAVVSGSQNFATLAARVCAIALGGYLALHGELSVGTLVAFLGYLTGLFGPVQGLSGSYKTLRTAQVAVEQVFDILDAQESLGDAPDARDIGPLEGAVRFENVEFNYVARQGPPLLQGISLDVKPGENIALVGPSGAGKTTLMSLLCRFYDPTRGAVYVDGQDLRTVKQRSLRGQVGVVLQDALLFNETVGENIAYGRPEATTEEIIAAAKAAHAHDFIMRLEKGYDTVVGERGNKLSAGERQRVAIARSLLKDPRILILDEPTSALDAESEALVQEALARLTQGRTTFAIAHRLSTVVGADRILVLKDGHIHEMGTHQELLRQNGYYASLVARQTRGLLSAPDGATVTPLPRVA